MQEGKYYDRPTGRSIDPDSEACDLAEWHRLCGIAPCAKHPRGFKIFLSPQKIAAYDEYAEADPYSLESGLGTGFHQRRITMTLELTRRVLRSSGRPCRIVDLGCGQGHITQRVCEELRSEIELSALDCSLSAVAYAYDHFPGIDFIVGDAHEPPYATSYFDLAICNNLWEHVPDPLRMLAEIKRILKPGGFLVLSTPSRYHVRNLVRVLRGKPIELTSERHITEYTVGQVEEQLRYGGFLVESIESRPIRLGSLALEAARRIFAAWISLVGSHHKLEGTIFYLARAVQDAKPPF